MSFWDSIFGTGGASFPTGMYQSMPPPPPPPYANAQQQLITSTSASLAQQQYGGFQNISAGGKGVGGIIGPQSMVYKIDEDVYKLTRYAEMCGDTVEMVDLPRGRETDDVKIAILKAADEGTVVKGVGIKINDERFAVYRDQGE
jgi:hypothetical protein